MYIYEPHIAKFKSNVGFCRLLFVLLSFSFEPFEKRDTEQTHFLKIGLIPTTFSLYSI